MPETADVLIAGGGPAGATAAALLASRGKRVVVVERAVAPQHKVCGEFLSYEVLRSMRNAGLDPWCMGAVPIRRVRVAANDLIAEQVLPFEAASLSRKVLDSALLQHAQDCGAQVIAGRRVEDFCSTPEGWQVLLDDGRSLRAEHGMLASGKHDLRGHARGPGLQPGLVAFKLHLQLSPEQTRRLRETVELVLFPGGYLGLQPTESSAANLCLLLEAKKLRQLGGTWADTLRHLTASSRFLRERLAGANECFARPLAISHIPYGYLRKETQPGLWPLGDQAAVIPSFSGDGMAIAFHTAQVAAQHLSSGADAATYLRHMRHNHSSQVQQATMISRAIIAMPWLAHGLKWFPSFIQRTALSTRIPHNSLPTELDPHTEAA